MSFTFQLCWQVQCKFPPPVKQPAGDSRRGDSAAPATTELNYMEKYIEKYMKKQDGWRAELRGEAH